jgi:phage host-nuclease inhibitor protein Gam
MHWFWLGFILLLLQPVAATPQFSQRECQQLNAKRLALQKQLRQPYTAEQGKQLQAQLKELLQLLQQHCKTPRKDEATARP